jgi:hypothetical protein
MFQGGYDVSIVRPDRKTRPPHAQRRVYVSRQVLQALAVEKPLPEPVWQSVKKAANIDGKFVPPVKK